MNKGMRSIIILAGLMAPAAAVAQSAANTSLPVRAESRVWFDGTSTAKSFTCKANKLSGTVEVAAGQAAAATLTGQKSVKDVDLTIPVASLACGNGTIAKLNGKLSIAGKENPIALNGTVSQDASGQLRLKGSKQLNMTEFGVKPPSLMMGAMKVGEAVTVHYDMVVKP